MIAKIVGSLTKSSYSRAAFLCAAFFSLATVQPAHADQTDDIVNATLDAFITLGPKYGFNITPNEKKFVAPFASCLVRGKPAVDCSKETIISFLPETVQPVARCVAKAMPVADCSIHLVPEEMQAASRCVNEVLRQEDACVKEQLIKRIPDERTRNLASCMNAGTSPILCASQFGQGDVASALSKIGGRNSESLGKPDGLISNIIGVIAGIQNKDFGKVLRDGGEAVAKLVARTALNILTAGTPFVNYVSGDIIDAVIEHRVDALVDVFNAVNNRDPGALTTVIINAYYTSFAVVPCTAMRTVFPIDAIPDALCGLAGKVFDLLGKAGGGFVGEAYNALVKGLEGLGVFDFFGRLGDAFSDDRSPEYCRSPLEYFTNYQLQCVRAAVTESLAATTYEDAAAKAAAVRKMREIVGHVQDGCRVWFEQCYDGTETINKYCNPLANPFIDTVEQTQQGIYDAARRFGSKLVSDSYASQRDTFCRSPEATANLLKFQCEDFLRKRFPMRLTPPVLFVNARDDADKLVDEHRYRRCTPSNYQMSSASSAETPACLFIGERVANLCQPKKPWHFEVRDTNPIRLQDKVDIDNASRFTGLGGDMTGADAREKLKTHMTAVSLATRGDLVVGPRSPLLHGGSNPTLSGGNVSRGAGIQDTVRVAPSARNNPVVVAPAAIPYGGMYPTAPNPQLQRQQTIPYQQRVVIPQQFPQTQPGIIGNRTSTFNVPAKPQQQPNVIRSRSSTFNAPTGGTNPTGPGVSQTRTTIQPIGKTQTAPANPDPRIRYGGCSGCKPPPPKMKVN